MWRPDLDEPGAHVPANDHREDVDEGNTTTSRWNTQRPDFRDLFGGALNAAERLVSKKGPNWARSRPGRMRTTVGAWLLMILIFSVPLSYLALKIPSVLHWLEPATRPQRARRPASGVHGVPSSRPAAAPRSPDAPNNDRGEPRLPR
jgi:hypothetical protein